jgi:hypothetical protein
VTHHDTPESLKARKDSESIVTKSSITTFEQPGQRNRIPVFPFPGPHWPARYPRTMADVSLSDDMSQQSHHSTQRSDTDSDGDQDRSRAWPSSQLTRARDRSRSSSESLLGNEHCGNECRLSAESALEEQADYSPMTRTMVDEDSQASQSEQETAQSAPQTMEGGRSSVYEQIGDTTSEEEQHGRSHDERLHRRFSRTTRNLHVQGHELMPYQPESLAGSSITSSDSEESDAANKRVPSDSSADLLLDQSQTNATRTRDHDLGKDRDLGESSRTRKRCKRVASIKMLGSRTILP